MSIFLFSFMLGESHSFYFSRLIVISLILLKWSMIFLIEKIERGLALAKRKMRDFAIMIPNFKEGPISIVNRIRNLS